MASKSLNTNQWCSLANIPESTLRSFLNSYSNTMTLQSLLKLSDAIHTPLDKIIFFDDEIYDYSELVDLTDGETIHYISEELLEINNATQLGLSFTTILDYSLQIFFYIQSNRPFFYSKNLLSTLIASWLFKEALKKKKC